MADWLNITEDSSGSEKSVWVEVGDLKEIP